MSLSKRKKALSMFQNDPPTTVFLLSIRAGAVGINLTQANFIVLLDACTNPALEAQAIGRVWRLGQKRKVHIRRYIMNNSIETRILDMEAEKNRKREEQEEEEDEEEETKKDEEGKDSSSSNSTTTTSTTNGSSNNNNNKKKKKKGSQNDPICIGFAETAVAGSIMSSTQRFRVNEFVKLFGVKDSELPEFYKNQEEDKKNKKKNTTISKKRKASSSSNQSSSSSSSKRKRFDLEKENDEDDCVIS
jgi:superfamily II DNA or RNA helicase